MKISENQKPTRVLTGYGGIWCWKPAAPTTEAEQDCLDDE